MKTLLSESEKVNIKIIIETIKDLKETLIRTIKITQMTWRMTMI